MTYGGHTHTHTEGTYGGLSRSPQDTVNYRLNYRLNYDGIASIIAANIAAGPLFLAQPRCAHGRPRAVRACHTPRTDGPHPSPAAGSVGRAAPATTARAAGRAGYTRGVGHHTLSKCKHVSALEIWAPRMPLHHASRRSRSRISISCGETTRPLTACRVCVHR